MKILAIDTALDQSSVCLFDTELGSPLASETLAMQRGHGEALIPMIQRVMADAALPFSAINRIAVTVGPGSFTGVRIGLSAARGLALALDCALVGVTTFSAFAGPIFAEKRGVPVVVVLDARNDQVYVQVFGDTGAPLAAPLACPLTEAAKALGVAQAIVTGTAASAFMVRAAAFGVDVQHYPSGHGPDIALVARIGAAAHPDRAPARPLYIRAPSVSVPRQSSFVQA